MPRDQAKATELVNDEKVRVTRFDFSPGAETGWHVHGMDYVITTLTECEMLLEDASGETRATTIPKGAAYRRDKGVEHNVINAGESDMAFVEVELK